MIAGMQSQLVCSGCRNVLVYPRGAANVCCAICNTITSVPPAGLSPSLFHFILALHSSNVSRLTCLYRYMILIKKTFIFLLLHFYADFVYLTALYTQIRNFILDVGSIIWV